MQFDPLEQEVLRAASAYDSLGCLTRAGDVQAAMALIADRPVNEVTLLMLRAGFSVFAPHHVGFNAYLQAQIKEACRLRVDGFALRARKHQRLHGGPATPQ